MTNQVRYPVSDQDSGDVQYARSTLNPAAANGLHCGSKLTEDDLLAELAGLRRRLDTLPVIEQSKGILMGYFGIDAACAFNVLRRWSSHTNTKLRDISQLLVDAASTPPGPGQPQGSALDHLITRLQARDSPAESGSGPASSRRTPHPGFRP
jgi:hypothetical protein